MSDTNFVPTTTITSAWLNDVNDFLYTDIGSTSDADSGAGMVGYDKTLAYNDDTVGAELQKAPYYYYSVGGGVTNELTTFQAAIDAAAGRTLVLHSGDTYLINGELEINDDIEITTDGISPATILTSTNSGYAIDVGGAITAAATTTLAANARIFSRFIEVADSTGIEAGHILRLRSNKAWYFDEREDTSISPSTDAYGTAVSGTTTSMVLKVGTTETDFVGETFTIIGGTNLGFTRTVLTYDSGTRTATFAAVPSAMDSTSKYSFPQLFKGELHLVRSVNGTTIELEDPLFDGYDVVNDTYGDNKEIVTIYSYAPLKVRIDNVYVERPFLNGANSYLMRLSYCANHEVSRFSGINGTITGVLDYNCYKGRYNKLNITASNDTGTGYGFQFNGSTFGDITDSDFRECRRGVDVSGFVPASFCSIRFCRNHGGGDQEDGQAYAPEGSVANFGFGSHSTSRGTLFENNLVTAVAYGINTRGREERIIANTFYGGISEACITLAYGANTTIRGNRYMNLYSEGSLANSFALTETNSFEAININGHVPYDFVFLSSPRGRGFTDISDNVAWGIRRYFLSINGVGTYYDISMRNNKSYFVPGSVSDECGLIGSDGDTVSLLGIAVSANEFSGGTNLTNLLRFGVGVGVSGETGLPSIIGDTYIVKAYAEDDAVVKVRVGQTGTYVKFDLVLANTVSWIFSGVLEINSTNMTSMGVQTLVEGLATAPAGTTGTDVRVNCHYDGYWLHIENRTGNARNFLITIYPGR